jgi:ribulose kinase
LPITILIRKEKVMFGFGTEVVAIPWYATTTAKVVGAVSAVIVGTVAARKFDREKLIEGCDRILNKKKQFFEEEKASKAKVHKAYRNYVVAQYEHEKLIEEHRKEIRSEKSKIRKELDEIGYGVVFRTNHWKVPEIQNA